MVTFIAKLRTSKNGYHEVSIPKGVVEKYSFRNGEKVEFIVKGRIE